MSTTISSSTGSSASSINASIRRIGEDPLLRPFLSSLFDGQAYVRSVIRDNRSEECFAAISDSVENINDEIQRYITQHKDVLMSGMQDVASLAKRYDHLSDHSKILQGTVQRLKKEMSESYNVVKSKTFELERMHETSGLLNQLKQFVKAKGQLDQYLRNPDDKDPRSLATAAKTVSELEKLLTNPRLLEIKIVSESVSAIKSFAANVRVLAQEKLLSAIAEKNQMSIANYLQVFYNLDSLPQVLLMVVDALVKQTTESVRDALDFDALHALYAESNGTHAHAGGKSSGVPLSATKKPLTGAQQTTAASGAAVNITQLRIAMKEIAHAWSSAIYDRATQIVILQRVLLKKEDPSSHEKFKDALKRLCGASLHTESNPRLEDTTSSSSDSLSLLSQAQLISIFWRRLSHNVNDICLTKLKTYPHIASRTYPYLRKAALEVIANVANLSQEDHSLSRATTAFLRALEIERERESLAERGLQDNGDRVSSTEEKEREGHTADRSEIVGGMFGSLLWSTQDMFQVSVSSLHPHRRPDTLSKALPAPRPRNDNASASSGSNGAENARGSVSIDAMEREEHELVKGLRPLRDRYLVHALERMNMPILQMFPELDGYVAAIPSKRDLQLLIKAVVHELVTVVIESDYHLLPLSSSSSSSFSAESARAHSHSLLLLYLLNREVVKSNRLLLSKIESMVAVSPDTRKLSLSPSTAALGSASQSGKDIVVSRNAAQEHNAQLFVLLSQFSESLEKIPQQVMRQVEESATLSVSAASAASLARLQQELSRSLSLSQDEVHAVMRSLLLAPLVSLLSDFALTSLLNLHREVVVVNAGPSTPASFTSSLLSYPSKSSAADPATLECSHTVQALIPQLSALAKAHLLSLPRSRLLDEALEELYVRVLQSYISSAALVRPVQEASNIRAMKDLSALETLLTSSFQLQNVRTDCPVMQEYKAYCRFLFEDSEAGVRLASAASSTATPPTAAALLQLPYISALRPSTILGYLLACAPAQCPLPTNALLGVSEKDRNADGLDLYLQSLLAQREREGLLPSVRALYTKERSAWRRVASEAQSWERLQQCLDTFFQRISVAEGEAQKQQLRRWYETILDIGSQFYR